MVYIILGTGFEEIEAIAPCDVLRRGGVEVSFAGIGGRQIESSHNVTVIADCTVEDIDMSKADMIVVPGGLGGVASIKASEKAMTIIKAAYDAGKKVAAICAGPTVLSELHILDGRRAVCYPGMEDEVVGAIMTRESPTVVDGNVITGRGAGASIDFGLALLEELKGKDAAREVCAAIHYAR